jgi:hypothetical protein
MGDLNKKFFKIFWTKRSESKNSRWKVNEARNEDWNRATRWVCGKVAQNLAQSILCQKRYIAFSAEKAGQKFGLLQYFGIQLPEENNCPKGENSPNLVTLNLGSLKRSLLSKFWGRKLALIRDGSFSKCFCLRLSPRPDAIQSKISHSRLPSLAVTNLQGGRSTVKTISIVSSVDNSISTLEISKSKQLSAGKWF